MFLVEQAIHLAAEMVLMNQYQVMAVHHFGVVVEAVLQLVDQVGTEKMDTLQMHLVLEEVEEMKKVVLQVLVGQVNMGSLS